MLKNRASVRRASVHFERWLRGKSEDKPGKAKKRAPRPPKKSLHQLLPRVHIHGHGRKSSAASSALPDEEEEHKDDHKDDHAHEVDEEEDVGLGIDPILLTAIQEDDVTYTFVRPNGTEVLYRVSSLIDLFLFSGKFEEPETGLEFDDEALEAVDHLAEEAGIGKRSVLEAKRNPGDFLPTCYDSTALIGLERCCGELVGKIPTIVEAAESLEEGQVMLLTHVLPGMKHYFAQMVEADVEFAAQSLEQYIVYVHGPPNRPVKDRHRLLPYVVSQMQELVYQSD